MPTIDVIKVCDVVRTNIRVSLKLSPASHGAQQKPVTDQTSSRFYFKSPSSWDTIARFISLHIIFPSRSFPHIVARKKKSDVLIVPSLDPICGLELYMAVPSFSCVYLMIGKPPLTLICWRGPWSSTASFSDYTCLTLNMLLTIPWICA